MAKFVLVPGAWLGSWAWKKVTPLLEAKGHDVYPVTLTGMGDRVHLASKDLGIENAITDVLNVIEYNDLDDIVLVGHSFAGKVAGAVADRVPTKVKVVIYLDAIVPDRVRTPQAGFDPTKEFGPPPAGGIGVPFNEKILDSIGKDVKGANRRWMLAKGTPWPIKYATEPITLSKRFDSVKSAYILCTDSGSNVDEIISGKWGPLFGPYKVIKGGHWPMVVKPEETAKDLLSLSRAR
jgi:pimeloyl-ACP methyl ester carboxylesterase